MADRLCYYTLYNSRDICEVHWAGISARLSVSDLDWPYRSRQGCMVYTPLYDLTENYKKYIYTICHLQSVPSRALLGDYGSGIAK